MLWNHQNISERIQQVQRIIDYNPRESMKSIAKSFQVSERTVKNLVLEDNEEMLSCQKIEKKIFKSDVKLS